MRIHSGDRSGIPPEMSAEPPRKKTRTEERPSKVAAPDVEPPKIQLEPFSGSGREIAPQERFLGRSNDGSSKILRIKLKDRVRQEEERRLQRKDALKKCKQIQYKIQAMKSIEQEDKQTEPEESQGLHQVMNTPVHKLAGSAKNDRYQSDSYDENGDGHKESAEEWNDQVKEAVVGPPLSEIRDCHHPERQLQRPVPELPGRGDEQITQTGSTLHENIREGQAIGSKEAPPPTKRIFSHFGDRPRSNANLGRFEKDNTQEGPSAHSASTVDQPCEKFWPFVVDGDSDLVMSAIFVYAVLWLRLLSLLAHCTQPFLAYVIAGTYIATYLSTLYQHINDFWYFEDLKLYIGALVYPSIVRCFSLNMMTEAFGPAYATTLVWFIPELTNIMQRISWFWRCTGMNEEPLAQISFQRYCRPDTSYIQGPSPRRSNIVQSFDVESSSWLYSVMWDMLLELVQYASFYVVLFSGDSWLAKMLALAFAYFVGSKYCPRPRFVDDARSVHDLILRLYNHRTNSGTIRCPSFSECLDHQPIVSHYLQVFAIKVVETVEGRPIDDGGFYSLRAQAISLVLFLVIFVLVAIILALGWHWSGPTVTVTFS